MFVLAEKCFDLCSVGVLGLWVGLLYEGTFGLLGLNEGVLAVHEVEVVGAQSSIVVRLGNEGSSNQFEGVEFG